MSVLNSAIGGFLATALIGGVAAVAGTVGTEASLILMVSLLAATAVMTTMTALRLPLAARVAVMAAICAFGLSAKTFDVPQFGTPALAAVADASVSSNVLRGWDGHFRADAAVNGGTIEMLVDTGASIVLLTHEDAARAGIDTDALVFDVPVLTANGQSHVATVTLDAVSIGAVSVANVRAAVAEPGQLHASLLGMSFIGEIEEAVIRKDRLILRN